MPSGFVDQRRCSNNAKDGNMVKVEELHDGTDDGFVTEDDSGSSSSDPSEAGLDPDSLQDPGDLDPEDAEEELALARWNPDDETFYDRLAALKDVVPPATRHSLARRWASLYDGTKTTGRWLGGAAWVVTTSLLLVGLPMALSIEGETMLVAQEKEFERQQQGQQSLVGMPGQMPIGGQPGQPGQTSVTPPGF